MIPTRRYEYVSSIPQQGNTLAMASVFSSLIEDSLHVMMREPGKVPEHGSISSPLAAWNRVQETTMSRLLLSPFRQNFCHNAIPPPSLASNVAIRSFAKSSHKRPRQVRRTYMHSRARNFIPQSVLYQPRPVAS